MKHFEGVEKFILTEEEAKTLIRARDILDDINQEAISYELQAETEASIDNINTILNNENDEVEFFVEKSKTAVSAEITIKITEY